MKLAVCNLVFGLAALAVWPTCHSHAAEPIPVPSPVSPRLPSGDFMASITVTNRYDTDRMLLDKKKNVKTEPSKNPLIQSITVKKIGAKILYQILWQSGKGSVAWQDGEKGVRVEETANGDVFVVRDGSSFLSSFGSLDKDAVSWIRKEDAIGEEVIEGRKCVHYRREMEFPENLKIPYEAWIDSVTGLPLKLDDESDLYEIKFAKEPPVGALVIPAKLLTELQRIDKEMKAPSYL